MGILIGLGFLLLFWGVWWLYHRLQRGSCPKDIYWGRR